MAFVIFARKTSGECAGIRQSTENHQLQEKSANPALTNVRQRSIIPVLLLTHSEYYSSEDVYYE